MRPIAPALKNATSHLQFLKFHAFSEDVQNRNSHMFLQKRVDFSNSGCVLSIQRVR